MTKIQEARQKAQEAWTKAGRPIPCYDPAYLQAREELARAEGAAGR